MTTLAANSSRRRLPNRRSSETHALSVGRQVLRAIQVLRLAGNELGKSH